jgi:DNA-binding PadR family transcriptional regulator
MTLTKELVAASTVPLVLSLLDGEDGYGYALIKRIRELSDDRIAWSDGMLYPVLRRLESQGLIRSYWRNADTGRRRRYYRIEPAGRRELARQIAQWDLVGSVLARLKEETPSCSS